jgi:beta-galactosidase
LSWPAARTLSNVAATFVTGNSLTLPATITISYRTDHGFVPVANPKITWATESGQPTTVTFDPVRTTEVRITMTSPTPGAASGFLRINQLTTG